MLLKEATASITTSVSTVRMATLLRSICASVRLLVWTWGEAGQVGLGQKAQNPGAQSCFDQHDQQFLGMTVEEATLFLAPLSLFCLVVLFR